MRRDKPVWKMGGGAILAHKGLRFGEKDATCQEALWGQFVKENRSNKRKKGVFYEK